MQIWRNQISRDRVLECVSTDGRRYSSESFTDADTESISVRGVDLKWVWPKEEVGGWVRSFVCLFVW